ncbi:TPR repeat-containing protein C19B12.01 [Fusarium oxysporum f. sp. albedinis]|nr:TPR repeat-containing protein C19B12.01 [Fusarium oxysporum f. sp. albedinis]
MSEITTEKLLVNTSVPCAIAIVYLFSPHFRSDFRLSAYPPQPHNHIIANTISRLWNSCVSLKKSSLSHHWYISYLQLSVYNKSHCQRPSSDRASGVLHHGSSMFKTLPTRVEGRTSYKGSINMYTFLSWLS